MEAIRERNLKPEEIEIGGGSEAVLYPADFKEPRKFIVKSATNELTDWGVRWVFILADEKYEYVLSSWNIVSKKKFKPFDIIGKEIILKPHSDKKVLLEIVAL